VLAAQRLGSDVLGMLHFSQPRGLLADPFSLDGRSAFRFFLLGVDDCPAFERRHHVRQP